MSTKIERQTIELLTPALLAGAYKERPEWRGASLHGQLHFWGRVLAHDESDSRKVRAGEARLMGGLVKEGGKVVPWAAPFAVWLEGADEPHPDEYPNCPHDDSKGWRRGLAAGAVGGLCWSRRPSAAWSGKGTEVVTILSEDFARLLRAWILLGALGQRANRAAGSVWIPGWSPNMGQFQEQIQRLRLPLEIKVLLLPCVDARSVPPRLRNAPPEEQLRGIATDTIRLRKDDAANNPLGYAGEGSERKASPLKFKVGRFSDGLRLIAVHDNRHGRGGQLRDAMDALRNKLIGELLAASETIAVADTPAIAAPIDAGIPSDEVSRLLGGTLTYSSFPRYQSEVEGWLRAGRFDVLAEFMRATQEPKYTGLRQKPWYAKAAAAIACK